LSALSVIPYLGPLISGILPIFFAIIFFENLKITLLFAIIIVIEQLIESYVLEPIIIGKEVQINPLIVIIAIATGGFIWGLAGMILFVPLFANIKIFSNYITVLRPLGFFLKHQKMALIKNEILRLYFFTLSFHLLFLHSLLLLHLVCHPALTDGIRLSQLESYL
jgi:hypothetical protein